MFIALVIAGVMNFVSYFYSDKIALAMYRAQAGDARTTAARLPGRRAADAENRHADAEDLRDSDRVAECFRHRTQSATCSVAVTQGILDLLNDEELEGVLAHELGHVNNRDILISSIAATIAGAITMLASMGRLAMIFGGMDGDRDERRGGGLAALLMLIVAPIAAMLIQLAVSRSREYQADATGAHFTGNPYALASALAKLDAYSRRRPMAASPSTAHLFIIQPLLGMNFGSLFSTHPPIAKRIERLTGRPGRVPTSQLKNSCKVRDSRCQRS